MDAAITTLAGSLGGVVLGAGAQMFQARRSRRWQVEDRRATQAAQHASLLWQERRTAYTAFMEAMLVLNDCFNWAWIASSALSKKETNSKALLETAREAMEKLPEASRTAMKRAQEVRLISGSPAVRTAVDNFMSAMVDFNPGAAFKENENHSREGQDLVNRLMLAYDEFTRAARAELVD